MTHGLQSRNREICLHEKDKKLEYNFLAVQNASNTTCGNLHCVYNRTIPIAKVTTNRCFLFIIIGFLSSTWKTRNVILVKGRVNLNPFPPCMIWVWVFFEEHLVLSIVNGLLIVLAVLILIK